jgi:hypothetical protein
MDGINGNVLAVDFLHSFGRPKAGEQIRDSDKILLQMSDKRSSGTMQIQFEKTPPVMNWAH